MTLTEALAVLHRAGRIRSQWLPGMAFGGSGFAFVGRIIDVEADGPCEWEYDGYHYRREDVGWYAPPRLPGPVTSDPCTVGGLLALLREASGDPLMHVHSQFVNVGDEPSRRAWKVWRGSGWWASSAGQHDTEGEAIEAALIALARAAG